MGIEDLLFYSFYINLSDYSFKIYKTQPYMAELLENSNNAIEAVNAYINYMVADESKEEMTAFLDMTTLKQRMKNTKVLDSVYNDPNIGWARAAFVVSDRNENDEVEAVSLVVEPITPGPETSMIETQKKHSLETEAKLWNCMKTLIYTNDVSSATNSIIKETMDYYNADRAYIFEFDWDNYIGINTYEVCAPNVEPVIDTLQEVPIDAMNTWIKVFDEKSLLLIKDLNELIGDESRKDEYDILAPQGIDSIIAAPVYQDQQLVGFLGVDNPKRNLDDITYIKNLAFLCIIKSIKEKEKIDLEKKSMFDTLTGTYNRKGYNEIIKHIRGDKHPLAYMQIDVDSFKKINDTYGHGVGDEVLRCIGRQLLELFRVDDYVFRIGGDEFVVLITNYKEGAWKRIGKKLQMFHIRLNQILKKEIYVTISAGISWSDTGFTEKMIPLADAALYHVKSNGRAGCCIFDTEHNILYEWKDEIREDTEVNALEGSYTGACRIELPNGDSSKGRLICNETARFLMGFDKSMTPEECFDAWKKGIDPYYYETIKKTRAILIEKGQAECTYIFHHPVMGEIMVRSGGRCLSNEDGIVLYGYHQSLQNTRIILSEDDSQKLIKAMMGLYFGAYYVDLYENAFSVFKATEQAKHLEKQEAPASKMIQDYIQKFVKPEHQEKMSRFMDLRTIQERLKDREFVEAEYQSEIKDLGWCRVRILVVLRNDDGEVTHVQILVASIDKEKRAQLEQEEAVKNAMNLQLRVGEIISKTSIIQTAIIEKTTGKTEVWVNAIFASSSKLFEFEELKSKGKNYIYEKDIEDFNVNFTLSHIIQEVEKNGCFKFITHYVKANQTIATMVFHFENMLSDHAKLLMVMEDITSVIPKYIEQMDTEIESRKKINQNVVEALGQSFFAIHYIDLRTEKFVVVRGTEYSKNMLKGCETLEQAFDTFIDTLVEPEFHERMHEFCDIKTVGKRLKGEKQVSCEYLSKIINSWCRTSFYPVEWDANGEVIQVLFAVSSIDASKAKEIEALIAAQKK